MRKSLKQLPRMLVHFASELSSQNIRYKIGNQCLIIYYLHDYVDEYKPRCTITSHKCEEKIFVRWDKLPTHVRLANDPKAYKIWPVRGETRYYDEWWKASGYVKRFLESEKAWQKKGIDYRK